MSDIKIECPNCRKSFKLNETLAAPFIDETRRKLETEFEEKEEELAKQKRAVAEDQKAFEKSKKIVEKEREAIEKDRERIDEEIAKRLKDQRAEIARDEARKAKVKLDEKMAERDLEMKDLREALDAKDAKLADAQKARIELVKKQRDLDEKIREVDLSVATKVAELIAPERERARKEADEAVRLRVAEKDKVIDDQKRQLAEAQRKLELGSQQLQGELQELDLEETLRGAFPRDNIEPVPKGHFGGDTIHRVLSPQGQICGTILWESKRTKNWLQGWTGKLKQDQREAKADLAIIVTQAMPSGLVTFGELDGVWVTAPAFAIPLASALRLSIVESYMARRATDGQQDKMAILYQYLTGPQFRQRVEAIKDAFTTMQEDLDVEQRVISKQWAKRRQQISRVMVSTVGMYGDLQAIAGKTLLEIEGLELKALPEPDPQQL